MFGLKLLFSLVGSIGSVAGLTSLSFRDWDPSHVWRVGNKKYFYLTTCKSRREKEDAGDRRWNYSDLSIYLKLEGGNSEVRNGTKLKLIGKGSYQRFKDTKSEFPMVYKDSEDLHQTISESLTDSRFSLSISGKTKNSWLGEGGGGEESSDWGQRIRCDTNKKIFTFDDFGTKGEDLRQANLSQITFSLYECDEINYKGVKGCSIKIEGERDKIGAAQNEKFKWVDGFKPIVIK